MWSATELDDMGVECISIKQAIIDVNVGCAHENFACLGIVLMGCLLAWGLCSWDVCLLGGCAHGMFACLGECPWRSFEQ